MKSTSMAMNSAAIKSLKRRRQALASSALSLAVLCPCVAHAALQFNINTVGEYDGIHVSSTGVFSNSVSNVLPNGGVIGVALRYPSGIQYSSNLWYFDPVAHTTSDLGFPALSSLPSIYTNLSYIEPGDGLAFTRLYGVNASGQAIGLTSVYKTTPGGSTGGQKERTKLSWVFDPTTNTITAIGLLDSAHYNPAGLSNSDGGYGNFTQVFGIANNGAVLGASSRYSGTTNQGDDAWVYNPSTHTTVAVALTGSRYEQFGGTYHVSLPQAMNTNGQMAGAAYVFNNNAQAGQDIWFYDSTSTSPTPFVIGLTGGNYYDTTILPGSVGMNNATVAGTSTDTTFRISSAWVYSIAKNVTSQVGFVSSPYTGTTTDGSNFPILSSTVTLLNSTGMAAGTSALYNGGATSSGQDAFIASAPAPITNVVTTTLIGLTDALHSSADGTVRSNSPSALNDSGRVVGTAARLTGGSGTNVWYYNGTTTTTIGLVSPPVYTDSNGKQTSSVLGLNAAGQTAGTSIRYSGTSTIGRDAWFYDPAAATTLKQIGLTGGQYLNADGVTQNSTATFLNSLGQVGGASSRYTGSSANGQDAWIFDPFLNQTYTLQLSVSSSNYAFSSIQAMGSNGAAIGSFEKFSGATDLGSFAFFFSTSHQLYDLGISVSGGLSSAGWQQLLSTSATNLALTDIAGIGQPTSGTNTKLYALSPALPGDAWLDGTINIDDYTAIDYGYANHLIGWNNGDFNRDGTVNALDYALIDASYRAQGGPQAADMISLHSAEFGQPYIDALTAIPEPHSLALLAMMLPSLLLRSQRSCNSRKINYLQHS